MPHITIEHSANVAQHHDVDQLVAVVHRAALDHGLPALDALRTRAAAREHYRVATGDDGLAFIAITCRMGPGRDLDEKQDFIASILDAAEAHLRSEGSPLAIAWSIEITEIDPDVRINRNHVRTALAERVDPPDTHPDAETDTHEPPEQQGRT